MKKTPSSAKSGNQPPTSEDGLPLRPLWKDLGGVSLLSLLTALALAAIFPPQGVWPLAFVALVPWAITTCRAHRAWTVHWLSYFAGFVFFLIALRWLMPITGLGYAALAAYLAFYWPLSAWAIRTGRRHGVSPIWSLPITWVACEFLRAVVMTGFPWLFLSHALYAQLPLVQIADITGAYGVTFVAAMVNGMLVELILQRYPGPGPAARRTQVFTGAVVTIVVLTGTLIYGGWRLGQRDFDNDRTLDGPRVAVIQHDFPLVSTPPYGENPYVILASYLALAADAAQHEPDLIVFPETVWSAVQNVEFIQAEEAVDDEHADLWAYSNLCHEAVSAFARGDYPTVNAVISRLERYLVSRELPRLPAGGGPPVTVVVGSMSIEQFPEATYPKVKRYNSALVYDPDGTQRALRYDKCHLVPFGEFVPFRYGRLHWLYRQLNRLSPFSQGGRIEYSLTPGDTLTIFELNTVEGTHCFGVPICYEDTTPYVIRNFVWNGPDRRVDFLINISNDGWFCHSNELPQHLAICTLRAVENRVGIARAVNTGISGFIDPDGRIYSRVTDDRGRSFGPGVIGYDLERVRLGTRSSLYGRFGDWLAWLCLGLTVVIWLAAVFERWVMALKHRLENLWRKGA